MSNSEIKIDRHVTAFVPGSIITGQVVWQLDAMPKSAELRLFWYTKGYGTQDIGIVAAQAFDNPQLADHRTFSLAIPEGPYSYFGKWISILWALELLLPPTAEVQRVELVISPGKEPLTLK